MKTIRLLIAMAFIMVSVYGFLSLGIKGIGRGTKIVTMDEGWNVSFNGGEITENVTLSDYKIRHVEKDDYVELTRNLPECGIVPAVGVFENHLAEIDIYVDGKIIYVSGQEKYESNRMVGYGRHLVQLPLDYEGKELKIVLKSGENNSFSTLLAPEIISASEANGYFLRKGFLPGAIAVADMIVGLCMSGIAIVFFISDKRFKQVLYIGLFSFFIGLWAFCDHDIVLLINPDYQSKTVSEYISLYLAPIFLFAYYGDKVKHNSTGLWMTIYRFLLGGDICLVTISVMLHITNVVHLTGMLQLHHIYILILIGYMAASFVRGIVKKQQKDTPFFLGILLLSVCGVTDIIYYNLLAFSKDIVGNFDGISYMGSAILVISMFIDFAEDTLAQAHQASEMEVYEKLANSDFLTGLSNRRQCELVFDEIDQEDTDYAIIAFDLNNLKTVNDKHGHAAGDRMLKDFADVLKSVFGSVGTVGRTGGDEFLVIIRHSDILNLDQMLLRLDEKIEESNKRRRDYKLSAARGVCTRADNKKNVRSAYRVADQRMYENKIQMKAEAKGKQS